MAEHALSDAGAQALGEFAPPPIGGQSFNLSLVSGSALDVNPPEVTNVTPASGTQLESRSAPVGFDVTDINPGVQVVIVTVKYANRVETQVVYDGSVFIRPFSTTLSQVVEITDGYRFTVVPENQWLGDIDEFFVYAIDKAGNVEGLP